MKSIDNGETENKQAIDFNAAKLIHGFWLAEIYCLLLFSVSPLSMLFIVSGPFMRSG